MRITRRRKKQKAASRRAENEKLALGRRLALGDSGVLGTTVARAVFPDPPALVLCYIVSMKEARRAGATETFSVSVDPKTKQALRALANRDFGGNLSALVTDLAEEARRRMAADAYLHRHGISTPSKVEADAVEAEIGRELTAWKKRAKKRKVA